MIETERFSLVSKLKEKRIPIILGLVGVIGLSVFGTLFYQAAFPEAVVQQTTTGSVGGVDKKTGFDGKNVNQNDPAAIQAYCDDVVASAKSGKGSIIRDLCVLDEVVKKHLPLMSDDEIAAMAQANPSCLETGYDSEGYNCFTGYNRANCNRGGKTEQGQECEPAPVKKLNDAATLLTGMPSNICDLVSGCQSESAFDPDGFNKFGCNRQGKRKDGTTCPYEYVTKIYGDDNRDQFGFNPQGFNKFNCDAQGVRPDGTSCPMAEVTRLYKKDGFDQFGLSEKGFNYAGCNVQGLREDGTVCEIKDIPRFFDKKTKWDQFGLTEGGYNAHNCSLEGFTPTGEMCDPANIPRIYGKDNKDQFGLRKDGRNENNCDIYGKKPDGSACPWDQAVKLFSPITGEDQFGMFFNGRNKFDCDVHGYKPDGSLCPLEQMVRVFDVKSQRDQNGLTIDGFNEKNCNLQGFDRNGARCAPSDTPRLINPVTGKDQFDFNEQGANDKGCLPTGFTVAGERCEQKDIPRLVNPKTGLDQLGLRKTSNGLFNEFGCNLQGLDTKGNPCPIDKITRIVDPKTGLDQFNLDSDGYLVPTGCNLQGVRRDGSRCKESEIPRIRGEDGYDQLGMNSQLRNRFDCDANGIKSDGSNCSANEMQQTVDADGIGVFHRDAAGFGRHGLNDKHVNKFDCDVNGRKPDGTLCNVDEIPHIFDPVTNLDQFGLNVDGFNEFGCNLKGVDVNGNACKAEHVPRIFDIDMVDQFGVGIKDLPMDVWVAEKNKTTELSPLLDSSGKQVFVNGEPAFVSADGVVRSKDGVALRDADGGMLRLADDNKVRSLSGALVPVTNSAGEVVTSPLQAKIPLKPGFTHMVNANGEQIIYGGKEVFLDPQNNLVDRFNSPIVNANGEALRLSESGQVVTANGKVEPLGNLKTLTGGVVSGALFGAVADMPLTDAKGRPVFVNGKAAFVAKNGALVDRENNPILGANGEALFLNSNNEITNEAGEKVTPPTFSTADGEIVKDVKRGDLLMPLVNDKGERILVDGIEAFVASDGSLVDIDNRPIRNADGEQMYVNDQGVVTNKLGETQDLSLFSTASNKAATGALHGAFTAKPLPLVDSNGERVFVNGVEAFLAADGSLVDINNRPIRNADGDKMYADEQGRIVNRLGQVQNMEQFKTASGKKVDGPLHGAKMTTSSPLVDANGERVFVNGVEAFVAEDGSLVDIDNRPIRNANGEKLYANDQGVITNELGQKQDLSSFKTASGKPVKGALHGAFSVRTTPLVNADGERVFVNGIEAFVAADGSLVDINNRPIRNANGEKLSTNERGDIVNAKGEIQDLSAFKTASGKIVTGALRGAPMSNSAPLIDANGERIFVNGVEAFVAEDGSLVDLNNRPVLNGNGEKLYANEQGNIVNADGKIQDLSAFKTASGKTVTGALRGAAMSNSAPLVDANGERVFVNGVEAFVAEDGSLVDLNNRPILNENGEKLYTNGQGEIINENGTVQGLGSFKTASGKAVTGGVHGALTKKSSPLVDSSGEQVLVNGVEAFVAADGSLVDINNRPIRNANGEKMYTNAQGVIVNELGQKQDLNSFKTASGKSVSGAMHGALSVKSSPLVDSNGERVFVNGVEAFVAADGSLVDIKNRPIRNASGEKMYANAQGVIVNKNNQKQDLSTFKTASGKAVTGALRGALVGKSAPLIDANGDKVFVNGVEAFVAEDGSLVDINNRPILNSDGEKMYTNDQGLIVSERGQSQDAGMFKTASGKKVTGPLRGAMSGMPLTTADGTQVFVEGKPAFVAPDGTIVDRFNQPLKNSRGESLHLAANGELITESGAVQPMAELKTALGKSVAGKLSAGKPALPLLDSSGQQVSLNGKPLFVSEDGTIVDSNNIPVKNSRNELLKLNGKGELETLSQQLQDLNLFANEKGEKVNGRLNRGPKTKQELEAEEAARRIDQELRTELGLDPDGYNAKGCDLNGLRRDGTVCPFIEVPWIYDKKTKLNQLGFASDGFNSFGCDELGNSRGGGKCQDKFVTRRYGIDGLGVDGIGRTGANAVGFTADLKNVLGCDPSEQNCEKGVAPQLLDSAGVNQFNARSNGTDRLKLKDFRNEQGCGLDGFKSDGSRCEAGDIPLLFNAEKRDQFNRDVDGYNTAGCNLQGRRLDGTQCSLVDTPRIFDPVTNLDQNGLNIAGYSTAGCNLQGFRVDGSRCEIKDIPRIRDINGKDQLGIFPDGFNDKGCDLLGRKSDGSLCLMADVTKIVDPKTGRDQFGLDGEGFNEFNCNLQGLNREGEICTPENIPRVRDAKNIDQLKLDAEGRNAQGCDIYGHLPSGERCDAKDLTRIFDKNDKDQHGASKKSGRNENGCDLNNKMPDGSTCKPTLQIRFKNKEGVDQFKLIDGKNENDCDINGLKPDGTRCELKDAPRVFDPVTGLDQFNLTKENRNEAGCGVDGRMPDGSLCEINNLVQLFDAKGIDQFGLDKDKRNANGCDLMGFRSDGSRCTHDEMPSIYGKDNLNYVGNDLTGFNLRGEDLAKRDRNGCDRENRKVDGSRCAKYRDLDLTLEDGAYMKEVNTSMVAWYSDQAKLSEIAPKLEVGNYQESEEPGNKPPAPINIVSTGPAFPKDTDKKVTDAENAKNAIVNIPMGYMTSIYVKTPANSDYTQDVYGVITDGELAGATVKGTIVTPYVDDPVMPRDKFNYEFKYIVFNRQTIPIDAVTINMENDSGMVEAEDVDYHIFQRYGGLVVGTAVDVLSAGFLDNQAEANAKQQADAIDKIATESVIFGKNSQELARQNMKVATKHTSDLAKLQFNRRPTIKSGPGPQLIIFRTDITDERLPLVFSGIDY